ncbi:hypothetical protein [Streptomyces celluloflavus]|uniref:hypothetical protein n=1 Tax=Streptomyces celluloflavus TaxID=58344 RepID=UPI0036AE235A
MNEEATPGGMTAGELRELLDTPADGWPSAGVRCLRADDQVQVWHGSDLVGYTEQSEEFPAMRTYHVVLTQRPDGPWSVAYPAGFLPPDPLWGQYTERLTWLPAGHPHRPPAGLDRAAFHALIARCPAADTADH